jgi:hypothetical protein
MSDTVCANCKAFAAECDTPVGEGSELCCWLCAHDLVFHGATFGTVGEACGCKREDVYPAHVIVKLDHELAAATRYRVRPEFMGRDSNRLQRERIARVESHRTGEHPTQH